MSASISGREAQPFLDALTDQEEQVQIRSQNGNNRLPCRTWTALRILGGVAALTVVVFACLQCGGRPLSARETDATTAVAVKEIGDPFTQCGGQGYAGKTCCKNGCACVRDSKYYSMCKPPTGVQTCDVGASKSEVKHAKDREHTAETELKEASTNMLNAKKGVKHSVQAVKTAKQEAKKATETWKAKDAQEKKEVDAAKSKQSDVFTSAVSDRDASVKSAILERATVENAAAEKLAKITKTAEASQDRIVTEAKETRDKAVKSARATKKQILDRAQAEMRSAEDEAKKKATAKREAATKERIQCIKDATTARDKAITEATDEWTAIENKAKADKAGPAHALEEAIRDSAAASKTLKKKVEELRNITDWVTDYKQQEEKRQTRKCSTMWKNCESSNCCSLGCKCQWHNKYYASCTSIFGPNNYCEKDRAIAKQKESMKVLPGLQNQHKYFKEDARFQAMVLADAQKKMDALDKQWAPSLEAAKKKLTDSIAKARNSYKQAEDSAMTKEKELIRDANETETDTISKEREKSNTAIQQANQIAAEVIAAARKKADETFTSTWDQTNATIKDATDAATTSITACKNKANSLIEVALKKEQEATSDAMVKVRKSTKVAHIAARDADNARKKAIHHVHKRKSEREAALKNLRHTMEILKAKRHNHAMAKLEVQTWVSAETGAISCKP